MGISGLKQFFRIRHSFYSLIWLMPVVYACAISEEFSGDYVSWVKHALKGSVSFHAFIASKNLFMGLLLLVAAFTYFVRGRFSAFLLITTGSALLFWYFIALVLSVPLFNCYPPGLLTATFLYYPLCSLIARNGLREKVLTPALFVCATTLGGLLLAVAIWGEFYHFAR